MFLSKELFASMQASNAVVYNATSIPTRIGKGLAQWGDGESFVITADVIKKEIHGVSFGLTTLDDDQDPADAEEIEMGDNELLAVIKANKLVFA